jgi:hypothetical protein
MYVGRLWFDVNIKFVWVASGCGGGCCCCSCPPLRVRTLAGRCIPLHQLPNGRWKFHLPKTGRIVFFSKQLYEDLVEHAYIPPNSWDVHHRDDHIENNLVDNLVTLALVRRSLIFCGCCFYVVCCLWGPLRGGGVGAAVLPSLFGNQSSKQGRGLQLASVAIGATMPCSGAVKKQTRGSSSSSSNSSSSSSSHSSSSSSSSSSRSSRSSQGELGGAMGEPGGARRSQEEPGGTRRS